MVKINFALTEKDEPMKKWKILGYKGNRLLCRMAKANAKKNGEQ